KGHITVSEDSLTSMVFDNLKYLPTEIFWRILKRALYYDKLPSTSGELNEMIFWEKWDVKDNTNNINKLYVEPDIFIRFETFDIILEAKRYNEKQQSNIQLREQIEGYYYNYGLENKQLFYIQMAGLLDKSD